MPHRAASNWSITSGSLERTGTGGNHLSACVLADAGYRSEPNLQHLEQRGIEGVVALGRNKDGSHAAPDPELEATCRMVKKLKTPRGRRQYAKRKYLAEPPFAWIKWVIGFNRFHLRGLTKVSCEWVSVLRTGLPRNY